MKKYVKWIVICLILIALGVYRLTADNMSGYVFVDNENGYFDEVTKDWDGNSLAPSQEKLDALASVEGVEGVYPHVYFLESLQEEGWQDKITEIEYVVDGEKKVLTLPKKMKWIEEEPERYFFYVNVYDYVDEKYVRHQMSQLNDGPISLGENRVVKSFANDSGVYISSLLYSALDCEIDAQSLSITLPLYVPTKMKTELIHYQTPVDEYGIPFIEETYDFYAEGQTITDYQLVYYTFEIEGVVDEPTVSLDYPVMLTQQIMDKVDTSKIQLEEGEEYYKPNSYLIKLDKEMSMKSIGKKIDEVVDNFAIKHTWGTKGVLSFSNK